MLDGKDKEIARLKAVHLVELQQQRDRLGAEHVKAVGALELRCSRLLEAEVRREEALRQLREELLVAMRRIRELEAEAAQIELLGQLLAMRAAHLAWLQHHLCAEQIARFGLSLKRAGQVVGRIRGCEQMSAEFSRAWPILEHLVELPRRYLEEEVLLRQIVKKKAKWGLVGGSLTMGPSSSSSVSPPRPPLSTAGGGSSTVITVLIDSKDGAPSPGLRTCTG
jgi:hypothetical protein